MVMDLAHARWRKKLLESRKENEIYYLIGLKQDGSADGVWFTYRNGQWEIKTDTNWEPKFFTDVDEATTYLISLGVEDYDREFGI